MVLQECIENAVKHNKSSKEDPLHIGMEIRENAIWITNNKRSQRVWSVSTQTGWENIKKRYELMGNALPQIEETETEYQVILLLLKKEKE